MRESPSRKRTPIPCSKKIRNEAAAHVAGGAKTAVLEDAKGVELEVSGEQVGVEPTPDLNGMDIRRQEANE